MKRESAVDSTSMVFKLVLRDAITNFDPPWPFKGASILVVKVRTRETRHVTIGPLINAGIVHSRRWVQEARVTRVFKKHKGKGWRKLWWSDGQHTGTIVRSAQGEGRDWARGWDTDDANALRVAVALDD